MASDGFFLHGGDYPNSSGEVRDKLCATCAFRPGEGTVRPSGVAPEDVWAETETCDDFVCHTRQADGTYPSCAGWHAYKAL